MSSQYPSTGGNGEGLPPYPQSDGQAQPQDGQPQYGQPQYGQPQYGQPQYGQPQYGQPQYGQPQYGQPQYGQPQYGQPQYGQPQYGQPQYGQPYGQAAYPATGRPPYANWGLRVAATLIDAIIITIPYVILLGVGTAVGGAGGGLIRTLAYLLNLAYFIWNYCLRQGRTGQTIGKGVIGIRVLREQDGSVLGPGLSFARYVLHIVDAIPCFLGYFWPLWDAKRQTFADKIVSSVVVKG